jgi:hypothetical protein
MYLQGQIMSFRKALLLGLICPTLHFQLALAEVDNWDEILLELGYPSKKSLITAILSDRGQEHILKVLEGDAPEVFDFLFNQQVISTEGPAFQELFEQAFICKKPKLIQAWIRRFPLQVERIADSKNREMILDSLVEMDDVDLLKSLLDRNVCSWNEEFTDNGGNLSGLAVTKKSPKIVGLYFQSHSQSKSNSLYHWITHESVEPLEFLLDSQLISPEESLGPIRNSPLTRKRTILECAILYHKYKVIEMYWKRYRNLFNETLGSMWFTAADFYFYNNDQQGLEFLLKLGLDANAIRGGKTFLERTYTDKDFLDLRSPAQGIEMRKLLIQYGGKRTEDHLP